MIRRIYQLFLFLFFLVILYLIIVKSFITWVQYDSKSFFSVVENITDIHVDANSLDIEQSWDSLKINIDSLSADSQDILLSVEHLAFDFNIFSPIFLSIKFGSQLNISDASFHLKKDPFLNFSPENNQPSISLKRLKQTWETVELSNITVHSFTTKKLQLKLKEFKASFKNKIVFAGKAELFVKNGGKSEIQYDGVFSANFKKDKGTGKANISIINPIDLTDIYQLLPGKISKKLPRGNLIGKANVEFYKGKLLDFSLSSNIQKLSWYQHAKKYVSPDLPKNIGFNLKILENKKDNLYRFKLDNISLDHKIIKNISPVFVGLDKNSKLSVSIAEFDLLSIKPIYKSLLKSLESLSYLDGLQNIQKLILKDTVASFDLETAQVEALNLEVPSFYYSQQGKIPGIKFKHLLVSKKGHDVALNFKKGFDLYVNYIHAKPIHFSLAKPLSLILGSEQTTWQIKKNKMKANKIPLVLGAKGDFEGDLDLELTIQPNSLREVKRYLPYSLMTKNLEHWLKEALVKGNNLNAKLAIKGNMQDFPFKKGKGKFYAEATIENAELKFQPNWPAVKNLTAKVIFTPYDLIIKAKKATLKNVDVSGVQVNVANLDSSNIALKISGKASSTAQHAVEFLQSSPLLKLAKIDGFIKDNVDLSGNVKLSLNKLWIPIYGFNHRDVTLKSQVTLNNVNLQLLEKIKIDNLNGKLQITENSVYSTGKIIGEFEGGEAEYSLTTKNNIININSFGVANIKSPYLSGIHPWQALLKLPLKEGIPISISADINLAESISKLPAPFNNLKALNEPKLHVELVLNELANDIRIKLSDQFLTQIKLSKNFKALTAFELAASPKNVKLSNKKNVDSYLVQASVQQFDLEAWLELMPKKTNGRSYYDETKWQPSYVEVNNFKVLGKKFKKVAINLYQVKQENLKELIISVSSKDVSLLMSKNKKDEMSINLEKLVLSEITESENTASQCEIIDLSTRLKNIVFKGRNITVGKRYIDKLDFTIQDDGNKLIADNIVAKLGGNKGVISGKYVYVRENQTSHLNARIKSRDIKYILAFLGVKKGLTGEKLKLNASLKWAGFANCFAKINLKGNIDYRLSEGVIKEAEPGIARLLGLLSIESLARRLSLNVNDVTKAGLAFDSIEGKGRFHKGIFGLEKMTLKAPAADVELFGEINLIQETLSLSADVTPAIGSSLPVIAAISGLATPLAGLAAYALLKVIPGINEDLITYKYKIKGSIFNPEIIDKGVGLSIIKTTVYEDDVDILDLE